MKQLRFFLSTLFLLVATWASADYVSATYHFVDEINVNGVTYRLYYVQAPYGYDQRVEVHCEKGCVQDSNDLENEIRISRGDGVYSAKPTWFFLERYNEEKGE